MTINKKSKVNNLSEGEKAFIERTYAEIIAYQFLKEKRKVSK
jgi:hypothetical protein